MIWGGIWHNGRSDCAFLQRDSNAPKNGYSSESYMDVLEQEIPCIWSPGYTFIQDNAGIYTSRRVMEWFAGKGIILLEWPPYSPDLNPIEHLWSLLKLWINEHYPELEDIGASQTDYSLFVRAINEAWETISQDTINKLVESVSERVEAVFQAKG